MSSGLWVLAGVIAGGVTSGVVGYVLQQRQFAHEVNMHMLKNKGVENVKALLIEMLSHQGYIDRTFGALRKAVGGYTDIEVRQFLHEIDAKKTTRNDGAEEWWYLASRGEERSAKRREGAE